MKVALDITIAAKNSKKSSGQHGITPYTWTAGTSVAALKRKLTPDEKWGYVLRLDSGWSILISYDDRPSISLPAAKDAEPVQVPLFAAKP